MICLFLGNRNLPKLIIKSIKRKKINFFIKYIYHKIIKYKEITSIEML